MSSEACNCGKCMGWVGTGGETGICLRLFDHDMLSPQTLEQAIEVMESMKDDRATALRYNADKPPLHLLAGEWQNEVAAVMGYGAKKYAPNNWRKGGPWCEHLASAQRHILAFQCGETMDPESGRHHLAHAICSLFFVLQWVLQGKGTDDRHSPNI